MSGHKNIKLIIAYDGTLFLGWQKTKTGRSVEQTLEEVIEQVLQEKISLQAASRTDRGVHATGQVVNFFSAKNTLFLSEWKKSFNALLPKDLKVLSCVEVPHVFHPTLNAWKKEYVYSICIGEQLPQNRFYSWHVPYPLDLDAMEKAAAFFIGVRDFSSFCNQRKGMLYSHKERSLFEIQLNSTEEKCLKIKISGHHFLYKMVRNIVGTLVYVGRGKILHTSMENIFAGKSRALAGMTAPAHGLSLQKIFYPEEMPI